MSSVGGVQCRRCPVSGSEADNFVKRKLLFCETAPGWVRNKDTKCVKLFLNLLVTGRLGFQFLVTGLSPGDTEFVLVDEMARTWSQVKTPVKPGEELAEGEGFEPPVPLRVRLISSQVPSTTQPPFRDSVLLGFSLSLGNSDLPPACIL